MKLSDWASKKEKDGYKTAWRWVKEGRMPVPFEQPPSGTILVHEAEPSTTNAVALYARVSSADPKADLDRQIARLMEFAMEQRLVVVKAVLCAVVRATFRSSPCQARFGGSRA